MQWQDHKRKTFIRDRTLHWINKFCFYIYVVLLFVCYWQCNRNKCLIAMQHQWHKNRRVEMKYCKFSNRAGNE